MDSLNLENNNVVENQIENQYIKKYVDSVKEDTLTKELAFLDKVCKDITEKCDIYAYLDEGILRDGTVENRVPIGEKSVINGFTKVEIFFNMTSKFVTTVIHFNNKISNEKASIYNLYDLYRHKCDEFFRANNNKVSCFDLYFIRQFEEEGFVTRILFSNPILMIKSDEEGTLTTIFDMKAMNYGLSAIDYNEIEETIQNEIADEVRIEEMEERHQEEIEAQQEFANAMTRVVDEDEDDF